MKYFITISFSLLLVAALVAGIAASNKQQACDEILRIHIRANSNLAVDQKVKYEIKDKLVEALIPLLVNCESKSDAENVMSKNFDYLENVAGAILKSNGFDYGCKCRLACEEFPQRMYDGIVFNQGFYDAIIVELGDAKGDNWWCVVYPPLCFLQNGSKQYKYSSKIMELVNKYKNNQTS